MTEREREICPGCGREIDPTTCSCGLPINHSPCEGHTPIPMGCDCMRVEPHMTREGQKLLAEQHVRAEQLLDYLNLKGR